MKYIFGLKKFDELYFNGAYLYAIKSHQNLMKQTSTKCNKRICS